MEIYSKYSCKIRHYNAVFQQTVAVYRHAVDFFIDVALREWDSISLLTGTRRNNQMERLTIRTRKNPAPLYPFEDKKKCFYKFPSYLRRAAISEAIGKVSSYQSNLASWMETDPVDRGRKPGMPVSGCVYPTLYRDNMYLQTDIYTARVKAYIRNTWDWIDISLRKSDRDYIRRHCADRKECAPVLQKRGKEWFLDFPFEQKVQLHTTKPEDIRILAVDLGINNACTVSVMGADGTILGRRFLSLPREQDSLHHAVNRIKKAQQHGASRTPRLWATAKGINDDIAVKTAHFIINTAVMYDVDVIVFEHLERGGKLQGSKKQKLHLWRSQYVQTMVTDKAHRLGMRISHVCAWGTSRLAYDGSGRALRGKEAGLGSYSVCQFQNGKIYNCDLSASYNIGARYFIRERLKSLPETARLDVLAKVPECSKRSTCTLSSLIRLDAVLAA